VLTPEILSVSQKLRRAEYERYINELVQLNEREFSKASDVKRGFDSLSQGF
jgi:hypothetical protein